MFLLLLFVVTNPQLVRVGQMAILIFPQWQIFISTYMRLRYTLNPLLSNGYELKPTKWLCYERESAANTSQPTTNDDDEQCQASVFAINDDIKKSKSSEGMEPRHVINYTTRDVVSFAVISAIWNYKDKPMRIPILHDFLHSHLIMPLK